MKKLIVNADDFGMNSKINLGIIQGHKNGVVTSAGLIVTGSAFEDAIKLLKETPTLAVGIHIDLDMFFEIDHEKGITKKWVVFNPDNTPPIEEVKNEIKKQIETLLSAGIHPDHLTSHHHSHIRAEILPVILEILKQYNIKAIRFPKKFYPTEENYQLHRSLLLSNNILYPSHFIEGWYWGNIDEPYEVAELVTHPGYGELWREYELSACCNPKLKDYLREKQIQLITFKDL
ncbi:MAG: ChbG/HpnK family deacetylase [Elusimicrobiota bacterium]|nr:ChbG/HpnK family deacetylase [Elusimicrobiota bacterium]